MNSRSPFHLDSGILTLRHMTDIINRYAKRLEAEDLWEVYDLATGRVVYMAGYPYDGMAEHEADEIVALLEAGEIVPDEDTGTKLH